MLIKAPLICSAMLVFWLSIFQFQSRRFNSQYFIGNLVKILKKNFLVQDEKRLSIITHKYLSKYSEILLRETAKADVKIDVGPYNFSCSGHSFENYAKNIDTNVQFKFDSYTFDTSRGSNNAFFSVNSKCQEVEIRLL